ncbi:hypothetical protein HPB49_020955 [Dermacentor silvarum]|uniref:Uncharacterized protein n=1 Tax=Dermacentor silvarum TaxID=543639 RepID=A0ACB8CZV8_DERSI|nr:hypothetical protein HPB49_020955 [Dermacentor silvarum]
MDPTQHTGRRLARAHSLHTRCRGTNSLGHFTAAVISEGHHIDGLSFRSPDTTHAEEVAIALAASHPTSRVIITDSRYACSRYLHGTIAPLAAHLLRAASWRFEPHSIRIVWSSCHTGLPAAHAAACVSPSRAVTTFDSASTPDTSAITQYRAILEHYRSSRRLYPDPARGLSKADERLLRRLQTNTLCPAAAQHFMPGVLADTYHMIAVCPSIPLPFSSPFPPTHKRGLGGVPAWLLYPGRSTLLGGPRPTD